MCRLTRSGIWLPASGALFKNGRCTIADFFWMSSRGTASSYSNARTSVKMSAFILQVQVVVGQQIKRAEEKRKAKRDALDEREAVPDARVRATEEGKEMTPHSRYGLDRLWWVVPPIGAVRSFPSARRPTSAQEHALEF